MTPFDREHEIDWLAYERLLARQVDAGVSGVVVCGTTGEAPSLSVQEKLSLVRKSRAILPDSIRVMVGTGGSNTAQSIELSKLAEDAGADSLLVVTPPYNKPSLAGLLEHFGAIGSAVSVPLCLYHVPGRTAQHLSLEDMQTLSRLPQVACVKEASADMGYFSRCVNTCAKVFLSGDDPTLLASLAVGGSGAISVVANVYPEAMVALLQSFDRGENTLAIKIHRILMPFIDACFVETNPGPVKAALHGLGMIEPTLRLPLVRVSEANDKRVRQIYTDTTAELSKLMGDA